MPKIKFSHEYSKLRNTISHIKTATLVGVYKIDLINQHKSFLNYDTDRGKYKLPPEGDYIMLLFLKPDNINLFTTLRRYTQSKYEYYFDLTGQEFDIIIKE